MLRGLRKASSNWVGKTIMAVVMGVLIVSFAIWGIADIFRGGGQSALAKVGSTQISSEQFRQLYTERLQQISQQIGRPLTMDQARGFGLDRQVLQQVVSEAVLDEDARRMGLSQSDAEIMRSIVEDPRFRGTNGAFDPARFNASMRQIGMSEQRYIAEQRRLGLRQQIARTITEGVEAPKTLVSALLKFRNEERTIEYLKLDAAQAGAIEAPSPEALAGYFEDHKLQFRAPEYRKISFAVATPDEISKWTDVPDDEARKAYEATREKLSTPERRTLSQIVFPSADDARAAREKIAAGTSFEDVAKERGLSPSDTDLGSVARSALDPAVAEAAFALPTGEVSQPVQGRFGTVLIKVGDIVPGNTPSFESVAPEIKRELAKQRAAAAINDLQTKMEDERGGGASVAEAAKKLGLTSVTIEAVDRSGRAPDGTPVATVPQGTNLIAQAFNSAVGVEPDPITYNGGYIWFDVLDVTPSHERSLDEVKDQVEARWREQQITTRLRTKAAEMVQKLEQGGALTALAAETGTTVASAGPFKRDSDNAGVPAGVIEAAFRTPKDGVAQAQGNGGAEWFVFRVTAISEPPVDQASEDVKKLQDTLTRSIADEQIVQYIATQEKQIGTTVNQAAVAQVTGAGGS